MIDYTSILFVFILFLCYLYLFNEIGKLLLQKRSYIFEFESFPDMHVCREFVGKAQLKFSVFPISLLLFY